MDVVRITELQPKTYVEQGDYIAIDNQSDGTKKVQFTNLLDDTLSQENKIAPANVVGDKIATVRDTMEDEIATIRAAVGSPLKASTVAQMTDKNKIYVYVGSESGYTNGNWYYWNGSAWVSGGVYNSVAVVTDPTLTLSGVPADAKATGADFKYVVGKTNLLESATWTSGAYISESGVITPYGTAKYTSLIPVSADKCLYTYRASSTSQTTRIHGYDSNGTWIKQITSFSTGTVVTVKTFAFYPTECAYIRISESTSVTPIALVDGGSAFDKLKVLDDDISMLTYNVSKMNLESGSWENNVKVSDNRRIRVMNRIPVSKGDVFYFIPNGLYCSFGIYENESTTTLLQGINWKGGSSDIIKVAIEHNGLMDLVFANASSWGSSSSIVVDDYVSSTSITQTIISDIISEIKQNPSILIKESDIEQGGWENNSKVTTSVRIRCAQRVYVGKNTLFRFLHNDDELYYAATLFSSESSSTILETSDWTQADYICKNDGYATITFANGATYATSTAITPSDFANEILYITPFTEVDKKTALETSALYGTPYYNKFVQYDKFMYGDEIVSGIDAPINFENFIWFTDPHTMYGTYTYDPANRTLGCRRFDQYIEELKFAYESTPTDFVVCGGDWIDGGLPDEELFKLSRAEEMCKANLAPFYNCIGNHDTNYQGRKDAESATYTTEFTPACLKDLWFRGQNHCYYTFNGKKTKFYVFDTRIEHQSMTAEDNYLMNQLKWFLNALLTDNSEHIGLVMHIYYDTGTSINTFAEYIAQVSCTYNARASYSYDSESYDYGNATGKIEFILAGHSHGDFTTSYQYEGKTIPVVASVNAGNGTGSTGSYYGAEHCIFDLINVNYDNGKMNLVRVGNLGSDRIVSLAN